MALASPCLADPAVGSTQPPPAQTSTEERANTPPPAQPQADDGAHRQSATAADHPAESGHAQATPLPEGKDDPPPPSAHETESPPTSPVPEETASPGQKHDSAQESPDNAKPTEPSVTTEQDSSPEQHDQAEASDKKEQTGQPPQTQDHSATGKSDPHQATGKEAPHGPASPAKDPHAKDSHGKDTHATATHEQVPEEIASMQSIELLKYADKAYADGRLDTASIAYKQLLTLKLTKAQIHNTLVGFARTLRRKGDLTKAVAVYERAIKEYPSEADTPELYLELGRAQRALGAYKTAITRFYSVINTTIKLPQDGAMKYRQLAKTAQFEIAETYFMSGDYKEASRFYSRLRLLDLTPADRARAHFKASYSLMLAGELQNALTQLRSFIELNPDDENVPEARYLVAMTLKKLNRQQEAMFEVITLLKMERSRTAQDPKRWAYWQRKTGNQLANDFYEAGDTTSALAIYLTLLNLSNEPAWRAPLLYQVALCQERQGRKDKASENYKAIIEIAAAQKPDDLRKADFANLAEMAKWRLGQLDWVEGAEQRINSLLPQGTSDPDSAPGDVPAPGNK